MSPQQVASLQLAELLEPPCDERNPPDWGATAAEVDDLAEDTPTAAKGTRPKASVAFEADAFEFDDDTGGVKRAPRRAVFWYLATV